jgi:hypothetical protein
MRSPAAELSSLSTALDEITKRVTAIADEYTSARREDLAGELYAVERSLLNAARRLHRVSST